MKISLSKNITLLFILLSSNLVFSQIISTNPLSIFNTTADFSNFKVINVTNSQNNPRIYYNYDIKGTYRGYNLTMYYNSISDDTRIFTNSVFDDSNYDPISYPSLTTIQTWNTIWDDYQNVKNASKYYLVVKTWPVFNPDGSILIPELTKTLTYTPPAPPTPINLKIKEVIITDPITGAIKYNSNNSGPIGLRQGKSYVFKVTVQKEGNIAVNNVEINSYQYNGYYVYPYVQLYNNYLATINFSANESTKTYQFEQFIPTFNGFNDVPLCLVFDVDKNKNIVESNESDNIFEKCGTGFSPNSPYGRFEAIDINGKPLRTYESTTEKEAISKTVNEFGINSFYLKDKTSGNIKRIKVK